MPLVAVPSSRLAPGRIDGWAAGAHAVPDTYVGALRRAGARPVLLTAPEPGPAHEVLAPFAGLVLAGGGDIEPGRYASWRDDRVYGVEPERDELELDLVAAALDAEIPVLAICRGAQVVNVAYGGTLHQHLPGALGRGAHGDPTSGVLVTHGVQASSGSNLAIAVGGERLATCTSVHHQGIERIGKGLVAVGWSDDGLVEALEVADPRSWLVAVQWHPEITAATDPQQQALFNAFAHEARRCAALV